MFSPKYNPLLLTRFKAPTIYLHHEQLAGLDVENTVKCYSRPYGYEPSLQCDPDGRAACVCRVLIALLCWFVCATGCEVLMGGAL